MADFFEWNNDLYDLEIDEMNNQHKILIAIMNRLHVLFLKKADRSSTEPVIVELMEYTIQHFREEEELQAKMGYPEIEVHKAVHKNLLNKFSQHYDDFKESGSLSEPFFQFLKTWLSGHIQTIDKKYAMHAKKVA